ncbi:MAG TPA: PAS domain S-box protein [Steroidobacteraceae bacterium]|jgi:two-component system sensor kinase FixL|nr:PAS domain S-box protein [Steroidobacteraceae bacterium]
MLSRETQAIMEAAADAIVVIDHRGRMTAINDATRRIFGYRSDELLGENVSMLMPEPDRSAHDDYIARHLETGEGRIIGRGRNVKAQRKDGSVFPMHLAVGRVPGSDPPSFVGLLRDVTSEHAALIAAQRERDRARAFLELHESILLELDAERRVREINARGCELLGATEAQILGRDWLEWMRGDAERERARSLLRGALASGRARAREFDAIDMAGTPRRVHWRCVAQRGPDGAPAGWLCAGTDVTDDARREADARVAQDRLTRVAQLATVGEMAAGVAHEINQPLTAITTYARACARYLDMPEPDFAELREAVREIGAEGLRAGEIIRRLRSMARSDGNETQVAANLNHTLVELRSLLMADARMYDARLTINLAAGLPTVVINGTQLQQVVLNLVRNAFEAVSALPAAKRAVELSTVRLEDGDVEIRVRDNGPGVDESIADKLFDQFTTTKAAGTGLGLAISRTVVQAHRGNIGVRKVEPHGAEFFVRLPAAEAVLAS